MTKPYDAIVIGAGSNGLVTAAYLARAGWKVLVVERRNVLGGVGAVEEFAPGFRADAALGMVWIPRPVIEDLKLRQHGLGIAASNPTVFAPLLGGDHLLLWQEVGQSAEAIRRFSTRDADRWPAFCAFVRKVAALLEAAYLTTPPNGLNPSLGEMPALADLALRLRRMGDRDMMETLRILPMSAQEFLDDWFESDALKGTLGMDAVRNLRQGPRSAGTTFNFLHHQVGNPEGRFRALIRTGRPLPDVLADAARAFGAEIRAGAGVVQIVIRDGQAVGVVLEDGEEVAARRIVSSADPAHTFLRLVDPLELSPDFIGKVRNIKFRGATAVVHLALGERPDFPALPGDGPHLRGTISISPDLTYLERAYDAAKYGEMSEQPALEITIPSLSDPAVAPQGKHVMAIRAQFAPYHLRDGSWDGAKREELLDAVLDILDDVAPNVRGAILGQRVITPLDFEQSYGLTEGSLNHGEMMLDQLYLMRPVPGWAQYRTPIDGLYLCGAGAHPGGGVIGAPAYNAAREIVRGGRG